MTDEIDWSSGYVTKDSVLSIHNIKPNYNMTFYKDGKQIGAMDWNGPEMTFTGDVDESAKVFFDWIAESFKGRLEQERADERESCAKVCDELAAKDKLSNYYAVAAKAIRDRGEK